MAACADVKPPRPATIPSCPRLRSRSTRAPHPVRHGLLPRAVRRPAVVATLLALIAVPAAAAGEISVQLTTSAASEAVKWYQRHLDCEPVEGRGEAIDCGNAVIEFTQAPIMGASQGTGIDHIGFSFPDLTEKMATLEKVGVRGSGVRLQRYDDGSTLREEPGLFLVGRIFDPWGTRIELVEDEETLGFHHVHLSASDPARTLDWYRETFGGVPESLRGVVDGLRFGEVWLFATRHPEGQPAPSAGRAIDHLAFEIADLDTAAASLRDRGVHFTRNPERPSGGRSEARRGFVAAPDNVRVAVLEPGWKGIETRFVLEDEAIASAEPYVVPRTPWGAPDLQGMWSGNKAHGIPLERPEELADVEELTAEEAAARRERGTLGSIWGYEREWRDTTLGYVKSAPSRQVAMIVDPPDGRLPPLTEEARERRRNASASFGDYVRRRPAGPEDLSAYVRCITRGLPGMMMPSIYNNGLQISQSPGFVAIQKEMIHETRVVPTAARAPLGPGIRQWLGDSQGRWEGDTLVVEVTNFNGRASYRGSSENMKLTERYTRLGPNRLEYRFTVEDLTVWTRSWTGRFEFELDNEQYELVEYACHEGNYGMTNILSGARARDREEAAAAAAETGSGAR